MLIAIGTVVAVLALGWSIYSYYRPHAQQTEPHLNQYLPARMVNEAVIFLDWTQKNHNAYIKSYPSFIAIRPYLTILQQEGFIEESSASNMDGSVYQLTARGQKALITAGVELK